MDAVVFLIAIRLFWCLLGISNMKMQTFFCISPTFRFNKEILR